MAGSIKYPAKNGKRWVPRYMTKEEVARFQKEIDAIIARRRGATPLRGVVKCVG